MAQSQLKSIKKIIVGLKDLQKKDPTEVALLMNDWTKEEVASFESGIEKLCKANVKERGTTVGHAERQEEARFLRNLALKLSAIEDQGVKVQTNCLEIIKMLALDLAKETQQELLQRWKALQKGIANLNVVKAMAQYEQARIINHFGNSKTEESLALEFAITIRKLRDYLAFYKLCKEYPSLLFTGYTMSTLLRFKKTIASLAMEDDRFGDQLRMQHETIELADNDGKRTEKSLSNWCEEQFVEFVDEDTVAAGEAADEAAREQEEIHNDIAEFVKN